jgi:phenylalanyl-tRNA synthetase beta chain
MLRPSLLPSLLAVLKGNQDVGYADVRLFETASTYSKAPDGRIVETRHLALLADADPKGESLRQVKGLLTELAWHLLGERPTCFEPAEHAHLVHGLTWRFEGEAQDALGRVGLLDAAKMDLFDLQGRLVVAEVALSPLLGGYPPVRRVRSLSRYPAIERDLSIVVDAAAAWADIERCVRQSEPQWLENVAFLATYRGKPIAAGFKSVSLRLTFRDPAGTLRHEQVDGQVERVVAQLKAELKAELRAG